MVNRLVYHQAGTQKENPREESQGFILLMSIDYVLTFFMKTPPKNRGVLIAYDY
jgi:hypothetical protein